MESYGEYNVRGNIKRYYKEDRIRSYEDAYLLGYLACDGGFVTNRGFPFMMVNSTELDIIKSFTEYCPDNTVYFVGKKSSEKVKAVNDVYEFRFSAKMSALWNNYGIFCKKPLRRMVGIRRDYFLPYFAGCLDADGFISVTHRKDTRTPRLRFFITHSSELFLSDLQNALSMWGVSTTLRQHGPRVYRLQAQNTEQNKRFLSDLLNFLRNKKKIQVTTSYLEKYFVPQASGELLEPRGISSQAQATACEGSETTGEVKPS